MSGDGPHTDVASYVLGVLDEEDTEAFERHLPACKSCQDELRELYDAPSMLDLARNSGLLTAPAPRRNRHRRAPTRRHAKSRTFVTVALAAAALVAATTAGAQTWVLVRDSVRDGTDIGLTGDARPAHLDGEVLSATDPSSGAEGTLTVEERDWGTEVFLELNGVTGPLRCQLFAVSQEGDREVVSSWQVAEDNGYGVPDHPEPLRLFGGTALERSDIRQFEIRAEDGSTVLIVPA